MKDKQPKIKQTILSNKEPKVVEDPAKWKGHYISWQISKIDENGKWGMSNLTKCKFGISDPLLEQLVQASCQNELTDILFNLEGKEFESVSDFLYVLLNKTKSDISAEQLRIIITHFRNNALWEEVYPKLKSIEAYTWYELERITYGNRDRKTSHHSVSIAKISKEAQKRLEELKLNDFEEIYSIRLNGKFRIWGIRMYSYLQIIWFDPEHTVLPVGYN